MRVTHLTTCASGAAAGDKSFATQLLEVYALQIQMHTELREYKKLGDLYHRALAIKGGVATPGIWGVIRECGGKMHLRERNWEGARLEFLDAFKAYEEAGNGTKTIQCLKYLLLAGMLSDSR